MVKTHSSKSKETMCDVFKITPHSSRFGQWEASPYRTYIYAFIYLFGVLRRFQHCTGHITTGSWKGRGNQYIQFVRVLYCKLPTNGKQLPAFPLEAVLGIEPRPQRWEARVLPLCHCGPDYIYAYIKLNNLHIINPVYGLTNQYPR